MTVQSGPPGFFFLPVETTPYKRTLEDTYVDRITDPRRGVPSLFESEDCVEDRVRHTRKMMSVDLCSW